MGMGGETRKFPTKGRVSIGISIVTVVDRTRKLSDKQLEALGRGGVAAPCPHMPP